MENLAIGWPQAIYLALTMMGFGVVAAKHGEPRGPYSIGVTLLSLCLTLPLLWWGGFFTN